MKDIFLSFKASLNLTKNEESHMWGFIDLKADLHGATFSCTTVARNSLTPYIQHKLFRVNQA